MSQKAFSPRTVFVVVSIITLFLLVGSVILQSIYFRADEVDSAAFLDPASFSVKPDSTVELQIRANFAGESLTTGGQFVLEYDQTKLKLQSLTPLEGWQTLKLEAGTSKIYWAFLPDQSIGTVVKTKNEIRFALVKLIALSVGPANININQAESSIISIDPSKSPAEYNAIRSVQNSVGAVSTSSGAITLPPISLPNKDQVLSVFKNQRIVRSEVIAATDTARVLLSLQYLGQVSVNFGITPQLNSVAESTESSTHHSIPLLGLSPNTRYYYQVAVYSPDRKSVTRGQVKTFTTTIEGTGRLSTNNTQITALPEKGKSFVDVIVSPRDEADASINSEISLEITSTTGQISQQSEQGNLIIGRAMPTSNSSERVTIGAISDGKVLKEIEVEFDPTIIEQSEQTPELKTRAGVTPINLLFLFGSMAGLLLFGLIFIHLSRSR